MNLPSWLKPLAITVAVLAAALLIAGELAVLYRSMQPPEGYDQPRMHFNTKNTTRFDGANAAEVGALVSRAVYPATTTTNTPDVIILYEESDWQGGLAATPLLRPFNAVLLPASIAGDTLSQLHPAGSEQLGGVQVLLVNSATAPAGTWRTQEITASDIPGLLNEAGVPPSQVLVVAANDPATALLAAPWAAYSGDLIVFDAADAPADLPQYALGPVTAEKAKRIDTGSPAAVAIAFARYKDPDNPHFGWGMDAESLTGYRAFTLARPDDPATALLSANLARRGKPGPLLWAGQQTLPQEVNNYLFSQRAAFWVTPSEGPFHHFWIMGDPQTISFPAQSQADYAVEIGPYMMKGYAAGPMDMLAAVWVVFGFASAAWIAFHEVKFLPHQNWLMRLAWPLLALMIGPFGIPLYGLAYNRPVIKHDQMVMWDRPLWLQGLVATVSAVGFGGLLMVATGFGLTLFGLPLIPNSGPFFWLGTPMILVMLINYGAAVLISWPLYQTPMISMFHGLSYLQALPKALPIVLASMAAAALGMFPGMWWLMMWNLPMMPTEESLLWFGVMFFTVFMAFLMAWPFNYLFVRQHSKSGLM